MKGVALLVAMSIGLPTVAYLDDYKIILEPIWQDLEGNAARSCEFDGKWILAGSITFRKKAKESVNLSRLYLHWTGAKIGHLLGSLYKKNLDEDFLPIEKNLVCDGTWNTAQQTLMLNFSKQQTLGLTNIFYLVLTVPEHLESTIRHGRFDLVDNCLPESFQPCSVNQKLSLALDTIGATVSEDRKK